MPRKPRGDIAGATFHVMNRGIARRTIFDTPSDYRFFLACLAWSAKRGQLTVLAYALMRTHFHLVVRSHGGLSDALRRIQLRHVRRFNRLHRRDGPLMRGRFRSHRVDSRSYERNVVHYTHENPVLARLCERPGDYRWSSAWLVGQIRVPKWFSPEAIARHGVHRRRPSTSRIVLMEARAELVEARLRTSTQHDEMPLDASTPWRVLDWMKRKAKLADGVHTTLPVTGPRNLVRYLDRTLERCGRTHVAVPGANTHPLRQLLLAGLLRHACSHSFAEIAALLEQSVSRARRLCRLHGHCIEHLPWYGALAAQAVREAVSLLDETPD